MDAESDDSEALAKADKAAMHPMKRLLIEKECSALHSTASSRIACLQRHAARSSKSRECDMPSEFAPLLVPAMHDIYN